MTKPSREEDESVPEPETMTHLLTYDSFSSAGPVSPSTEKPCDTKNDVIYRCYSADYDSN